MRPIANPPMTGNHPPEKFRKKSSASSSAPPPSAPLTKSSSQQSSLLPYDVALAQIKRKREEDAKEAQDHQEEEAKEKQEKTDENTRARVKQFNAITEEDCRRHQHQLEIQQIEFKNTQ